ncbi:2-oxoacid:acceptor oxidoreductase subunit alpha [bacterium]|nr:2-oxoacid:acceptor oxidoreductase subunit alpha [bacterium]
MSGTHNFSGSEACAEGALSAGCGFLAAYPIVPSLEILERFSMRFSDFGAVYIQMEDEISTLAAVLGAAWTGRKAMTVTSGPGFSLMMEHVGLGIMLETPCVIVDVGRFGPSEGIPGKPGQGDVMQMRWGSHGDYEVIVLSPNSPQEMFDLTIRAFNLSEQYRTPVMVMTDETVAHMREEVTIPLVEDIEIIQRRYYKGPKDKYLPFKRDENLVPEMVDIGEGYRFHVTGLTHNEKGYPIIDAETQEANVHAIVNKIRLNSDKIVEFEEDNIENADVVVVSYGITSRDVSEAVQRVRGEGVRVGTLRLITVWPFPEKRITQLAEKIKAFVVPEINYGQICFEVERCARGKAETLSVFHDRSDDNGVSNIIDTIKRALQGSV